MRHSFLLICLLLVPPGLAAQGPRAAPFVTFTVAGPRAPAPTGTDSILPPADELGMALGGLLSGFSGIVIGAYIGSMIDRADGCGEWCGLEGALYGAVVGSALMIPVGVHLVNHQRGELGRSVGYSLLIGGAGLAAAFATEDGRPLLLIPITQIILSIATEKATTDGPRP